MARSRGTKKEPLEKLNKNNRLYIIIKGGENASDSAIERK
jgi:hypothetical protein